MKHLDFEFPRRVLTTLAALALKLDKPEIALEIISLLSDQNYIEVRSMKMQALAQLKYFDKVLHLLSESLSTKNNEFFFVDTVNFIYFSYV